MKRSLIAFGCLLLAGPALACESAWRLPIKIRGRFTLVDVGISGDALGRRWSRIPVAGIGEMAVQHGIEIEYGATYRKSSIVKPFLEDLRIFLTGKSFSTPNELKRMLADWRLSLRRWS